MVAALEPVTHCLVNMVGFVKKNTKVLLVTVPNRLTRYGNIGCGVSNSGIQNQINIWPKKQAQKKIHNTGTPPLTRFSYSAVFYLTRFFLNTKTAIFSWPKVKNYFFFPKIEKNV